MNESRRKFIINGLGYISLSLNMPAFLKAAVADDDKTMMGTAGAASAVARVLPAIPRGKILVVIEMSGGNDGLNTVIPYSDPTYAALRPIIGVRPADVVKINDRLGLNPAMKALAELYEKGQVGVVVGAGYPNPNRSHFESMDIWQSGNPDRSRTERSGWLARYFDAEGHYHGNPVSGLVLGSALPLAMLSHDSPVSVIGNGRNFFRDAALIGHPEAAGPMDGSGTVASSNADFIRNVGADIYSSSEELKKAMAHYDINAAKAAAYPAGNGLAQSLQTIASLITGGLGTRIYYTNIGGFDTHANQPPQQANVLGALSDAVAAFQRDLAFAGRDKDVLTLTFSEFGRRVHENGSAGTDHGAAGALFVVGGGVRGGIYGEQPSLADLDSGDLRYNTDFRRVYTTVLENWMATPAEPIFGSKFDTLNFV